jgi:DNA adenine methylase
MKPFLKWAGGKHRLADKIKQVLPKGERLVEPFVGSGAIFLNTNYSSYLLADANRDLIDLYLCVQNQLNELIEEINFLFISENNDEKSFYELRLEFNTINVSIRKSALFVYLNRHCFNGLCRYNSSGFFNVPFGRYSNPIAPIEEIINFSQKSKSATFIHQDFIRTFEMCKVNDVIYCDPPYAPLELDPIFTNYTASGFTLNQQLALAASAIKSRENGIPVVISNHDTAFTRKTYSSAKNVIGFDVQRFIAAKASKRTMAAELLAIY